MADEEIKPRKSRPKSALIQTKLPSAFFTPSKSVHTSVKSPYFFSSSSSSPNNTTITPTAASTSPAAADSSLSSAGISNPDIAAKFSLYPERRSKLAREPPPPPPSSPPAPQQQQSSTTTTRSSLLASVAFETKSLLPNILAAAYGPKDGPAAASAGYLYHANQNLPSLSSHDCPSLPLTRVRVLNGDSLDTALALSSSSSSSSSTIATKKSCVSFFSEKQKKAVLVLNMANAQHGGGGWLKGALAQEEEICYRSSLSFTLKRRYYPIPDFAGIYSPSVLVIRGSLASGHNLLDLSDLASLPVVSVVSVAAVREPEVVEDGGYRYGKVRLVMKEKMRVVLRIAAGMGHRSLVLGALGCGAFGNPRGEVALCWKEVLIEREFSGGWWEQVVFAVMEEGGQKDGDGNYGVFWRELHGLEI